MSNHSIHYHMRALHRDIGFVVLGLTLIYAISGILLIYRDVDFMKVEKHISKKIALNSSDEALAKELHIRKLNVEKTEGDVVYFSNGTYNRATGMAEYKTHELPFVLEKMTSLHKKSSRTAMHIFSTIYGVLLLFLGISSFWMYKPGSDKFVRSLLLAGIGILAALVLLFI